MIRDAPYVPTHEPERLNAMIPSDELTRELGRASKRVAALLKGRAVWCVSATAFSGGIAELISSYAAYARGGGMDIRWEVLDADDDFFALARRLNDNLNGELDSGPYDDADHERYEAALEATGASLAARIAPGDMVILHGVHTAGLVEAAQDAGAVVVWRCHVGRDEPNELARRAWNFLTPYVKGADLFVFSRSDFVWDALDRDRALVVTPTLNPLSPKNQQLNPSVVAAVLEVTGIQANGRSSHDARFVRLDGTPYRVDHVAQTVQDEPIPREAKLIVQVSHWSRLKDPTGVITIFAEHVAAHTGAHLVIAGPPPEATIDEPNAPAVFAEACARRDALPDEIRRRVHLVCIPADDPEEAAAIVNALQRRAAVVLQKSRGEGFGMTVLEAMWKGVPVVCTRVGGLQEQVVDGVTGFLIEPGDHPAGGAAILRLLNDLELQQRMGAAAHERVRVHFLLPLGALQWATVVERALAGDRPAVQA